MVNKLTLFLSIGLFLLISTKSIAADLNENSVLRCAFLPDIQAGKAGEVSCSYNAEKMFSFASSPHPAANHCSVENITSTSGWKDVSIDLNNGTIKIEVENFSHPETRKYLIANDAKTNQVSIETARNNFEKSSTTYIQRPIISKNITEDIMFMDTLTNKPYGGGKRKFVKSLNILFGEKGETNNMHIFGNNLQAINTSFTTLGDSSVVRIRFGKCEIIE